MHSSGHFNRFLTRTRILKRYIVKSFMDNKKIPVEQKIASRIGYMGSGFLIAAQWTIEPSLYIVGFLFVIVQVIYRKQWNLVALNINGLIAWIKHLIM